MKAARIFWVTACVAFSVSSGIAAEARGGAGSGKAVLAKRIVSELRSKKGIALDFGCGNAGLAVELARQSDLLIYCVDSDEKAVKSARKAINAVGLYGTRVSARQAPLDRLPYPDLCMNLVVCGDEFANGKRDRSFKEIYRVLSPNGIAFIGQSATASKAGKKLTRGELESWLKEGGIRTYKIIDEGGMWAKITRPPLPGSKEWSHRCQGPGNPHGSNDTAIQPPFRTQWINQATDTLGNSFLLVTGGRQFLLSYSQVGHPTDTAPSIHAYDAYNGFLIWSRVGKEELPINRDLGHYTPAHVSSEAVATEKTLYVLGGKKCVAFDAETGEVVRSFPIPEGTEAGEKDIWLYVAHTDNLLFGAVGPTPRIVFLSRGVVKPTRFGKAFLRGTCHTVFALDPSTGNVVWKSPYKIMTNSLAVGGGRLYFLDTDMVLHALDAKTGERLWSSKERVLPAETIPKLLTYYREKIWIAGWKAAWFDLHRDEGPLRCVPVFSAGDGKYLFDAEFPVLDDSGKRADKGMLSFITFAGDFALSQEGHSGVPKVMVNVETGRARWARKLSVGSCGPIVATPKYAFGKTNWLNLETGKGGRYGPLRASCYVLAVPANGMVYVPASGCPCGFVFRGNIAFSHGTVSGIDTSRERLVKGPAFKEAIADGEKNAWVSWRNGPKRSGKTAEAASPPFREIWTMPTADLATPLAASDGLVYVGSMSRKLYGIDAATGKQKWQYIADGEIRIAPWLWKGRLYVGDDDGWVHCVRASDGALIWKFWAALADDQAFANGRLCSRWRAGCGVLVDNGTAYFTAGFFPYDGTAIYALDARTGELKKRINQRFAASGMLAAGNDLLYIPNQWDDARAIKLDAENEWEGRRPMVRLGSRTRGLKPRGAHIMVVDDKVIVRSPDLRVIRGTAQWDWRGLLPIVTEDRVYLRSGRWMTGENRDALEAAPYRDTKVAFIFRPVNVRIKKHRDRARVNKYLSSLVHGRQPTPDTLRWSARKDEPMTAIIMAGDVLISGGKGKVYATAAADGKELWSADVPGEVTDLAFQGGRLFVVCRPGTLVCFEGKRKPR